jgi:hypothetical protein
MDNKIVKHPDLSQITSYLYLSSLPKDNLGLAEAGTGDDLQISAIHSMSTTSI